MRIENFARKSLEDRLTAAFVLKLMNPIKNETFDVFIPFVRILYFLHPGPPSPSPSPRPRHPSISSFSSSSLFFFLLLFPSFPFFFLLFPSFSFFSLLFPFSPLFSPRWQGTARGACGAREAPWGARPKANAFSAYRGIRSWAQTNIYSMTITVSMMKCGIIDKMHIAKLRNSAQNTRSFNY